jgi:hypothetical protein
MHWWCGTVRAPAPDAVKEALVQTSVEPLTPRDASCSDAPGAAAAPGATPLFPPRDADAETRRRWLASSPWPEVVFASAGGG